MSIGIDKLNSQELQSYSSSP